MYVSRTAAPDATSLVTVGGTAAKFGLEARLSRVEAELQSSRPGTASAGWPKGTIPR
jgi:hypothetical protein